MEKETIENGGLNDAAALRLQVKSLERRLKQVWTLYQDALKLNQKYEERLSALASLELMRRDGSAKDDDGKERIRPSDVQKDQAGVGTQTNPGAEPIGLQESSIDVGSRSKSELLEEASKCCNVIESSVVDEEESAPVDKGKETLAAAIPATEEVENEDVPNNQDPFPVVIESSIPPEMNLFIEPTQYLQEHQAFSLSKRQQSRRAETTPERSHRGTKVSDQISSPDLLCDDLSTTSPRTKRNKSDGVTMPDKVRSMPPAETTQKEAVPTFISPQVVTNDIASPDLLSHNQAIPRASPVAMRKFDKDDYNAVVNTAMPVTVKPTSIYQDVVRKKSERAALPGGCCEECRSFYQQLAPEEDIQAVMNRYSRHRHLCPPPATPEGYWEVWSLPEESAPPTPKFRAAALGLFRPQEKNKESN